MEVGKQQIGANFCFSFVEFAVLLTGRGGRHQVQKPVDVMVDNFLDAKELC